MAKYYRYKDVLLGLRHEYLKMKESLDELNKYVTPNIKGVDSVSFSLEHTETDYPLTNFTLNYNPKYFIKRTKTPKYILQHGFVRRQNSDYLYFDSSPVLSFNDRDSFNKKLSEIKESDFVTNIDDLNIWMRNNHEDFRLCSWMSLNSSVNGLSLKRKDKDKISYLNYYDNDTIELISDDRLDLFRLLESSIPISLINEYQRKIIEDNYIGYNRDIYLEGTNKDYPYFKIEDDNDYIILKRVKK